MEAKDLCDITISIDCDGQDDINAMDVMVDAYLDGSEVVYNHADYRLISSRVLQEFAKFKEVNLFLRGLIPLVGFKSSSVYYERNERIAGESHYPLKKMLALAFDGITSLSVKPMHLIIGTGGLTCAISIIALFCALFSGAVNVLLTAVICFMLGLNLLGLGIVGEYIGKIYLETKRRPRYIISERTCELSSVLQKHDA